MQSEARTDQFFEVNPIAPGDAGAPARQPDRLTPESVELRRNGRRGGVERRGPGGLDRRRPGRVERRRAGDVGRGRRGLLDRRRPDMLDRRRGGAVDRRQPRPPRVSVVVPAMNEAANLPHVLTLIPDSVHEVILVDGNSVDDTVKVARAVLPDIRIVMQSGSGKGNALACGFAAAKGDIIVMLDADGSTDPREIPQFVDALLEGADFAKGSRFLGDGGSADITVLRKAGNEFLCSMVNLLFGTRYSDLCYGYNAFWARCLPHMRVDCNGFEVETHINVRIARSGLQVAEVPSQEYERRYGVSNLHPVRDGLRVLRTIIGERLREKDCREDPEGWRPRYEELPRQSGRRAAVEDALA